MHFHLVRCLLAFGSLTAVAVTPAPLWSQSSVSPAESDSARFLADVARIYDTADGRAMDNDPHGRLRIYRDVMGRMGAASPAVRATAAWRRMHLFYSIALTTTLADAGEPDLAEREIDALLPQVREFVSRNPRDLSMLEGQWRLMRSKGQFAQSRGDVQVALPIFRAIVPGMESLVADDVFPDRDYGERGLAIDLDNLANLEARAGNRAEANRASARALDLFRALAARAPDSRPAQGSLLIALLRRALNFREVDRLDEAERQIAVMRERGQLVGRYADLPSQIPALRAEITGATPR